MKGLEVDALDGFRSKEDDDDEAKAVPTEDVEHDGGAEGRLSVTEDDIEVIVGAHMYTRYRGREDKQQRGGGS